LMSKQLVRVGIQTN